MYWVTRAGVRLDRVACAWLILRRIDPQATLAYLDDAALVAAIAEGALPFHNTTSEDPDTTAEPEADERTSFSLLLAEYKLDQSDPALVLFSDIIDGAEIKPAAAVPEAAGVQAIAKGMNALAGSDEEMVARMAPVFDALYAYCGRRVRGQLQWANEPLQAAPAK